MLYLAQCMFMLLALCSRAGALSVGDVRGSLTQPTAALLDEQTEDVVNELPAPLNPTQDKLLLYTYGKVGSSALQTTMGDCMRTGFINFVPEKMYKYGSAIDTHSPFVAEDFLAKVPNGTRVWLLAATRNPFTHEVSNFFEQVMGIMHGASNVLHANVSTLSSEFHEHFKRSIQMHNEWFMTTLARVSGVNVKERAKHFDFDKKRLVIQHQYGSKTLVMVVVRFEEIDQWNSILAPLFPGFNMVMARMGEASWYADKYEEFKKGYRWTHDQIQQKLKSDSLPFYTEEEKQDMLKRVKVE